MAAIGTIFITAAVGFTAAAIGWQRIRSVARARAAFDLIVDKETAQVELLRAVWLLVKGGLDVEDVAGHVPTGIAPSPSQPTDWRESLHTKNLPIPQQQFFLINECLNWYETVAIAIYKHIVDEKTVKRFLAPRYIGFADMLSPFIDRRRKDEDDPGLWIEFTNLARRWGWRPQPRP